jgi:M6 family metalloprotease-like protein
MTQRHPSHRFRRNIARAIFTVGVMLLGGLCTLSASAVTLEDFGYGQMRPPDRPNGGEARGIRPLLVILAQFDGRPAFTLTQATYDTLVFNTLQRSVNGYFLVNSNGRFSWTRDGGGTTRIFQFPGSVLAWPEKQRMAHVLKTAAVLSGIDFSQFDTNRDGSVTTDELGILMIDNVTQNGGANRDTDPVCVRPEGFQVSLCLRIAAAGHRASLMTICHELTHSLGALDIYGANCFSNNLTLMGCSPGGTDDRTTFHLDPWHKMQLGWFEPRIRSMRAPGTESLPAANTVQPGAPVLLYDPVLGTSEYFLLEYRSARNRAGLHYDENVAGTGLVVWHIKQDGNKNPILIPNVGYAVYADGAPGLVRGGNTVWGSTVITPTLRWLDGSSAAVRVQSRPFAPTDSQIIIDWCRVIPL